MPTVSARRPRRVRSLAAAVALALIAVPFAGLTPSFAAEDDSPVAFASSDALTPDADGLITVRIGDLHPTQPGVGYDQIYYKVGRYEMGSDLGYDDINKRFGDWCESNGQKDVASAEPNATLLDPTTFTCERSVDDPKLADMNTVVIGPGKVLYLTDGHHTFTSFAETPGVGMDMTIRVRVVADLSDLDETAFWDEMRAQAWVWLKDSAGNDITPADLPSSLGLASMADDPIRALLYFARDIGYSKPKEPIPFLEFYWSEWVRTSSGIDLSTWDANDRASYLATIRTLTEKQAALPQDSVLVGSLTAAQMGALTAWNDGKKEDKGEWESVNRPIDGLKKPGKLAYALAYKAQLPPPATAPDAPAAPRLALVGTNSVRVSWTAPDNGGSEITGYLVRVGEREPVLVDANVDELTVEGLAPGPVTASVAAVNTVGVSAESPASASVVIPEAPKPTPTPTPTSTATATPTPSPSATTGGTTTPATGGTKTAPSGSLATSGGTADVTGAFAAVALLAAGLGLIAVRRRAQRAGSAEG